MFRKKAGLEDVERGTGIEREIDIEPSAQMLPETADDEIGEPGAAEPEAEPTETLESETAQSDPVIAFLRSQARDAGANSAGKTPSPRHSESPVGDAQDSLRNALDRLISAGSRP
jgi:hypothetical protein